MTEETHEEGAAGTDAPAEEKVDAVIEMKGSGPCRSISN